MAKKLKKGVDKRKTMWYTIQAPKKRGENNGAGSEKIPKKTWKSFEKGVDKRKKLCYNNKVADTAEGREPEAEPETSIRSLKIEQQNFEHKICVKESRKHIE